MSRWIALHCGEETQTLLTNHPGAFLLLTQISMRAKWKDCPITRLKMGQAFIGDWKEAGLHSEMAYRHAKKVLERCQIATFRGTPKGTIATLCNSTIYSISNEPRNGQGNRLGTDEEQAGNGQGTTNHTDTQIDGKTDTKSLSSGDDLAESIYKEYPRKEAKKPGIAAIKKALKKNTASFLLERTKTFAELISWKEKRFIPLPATWFNEERFSDDPEAWKQPQKNYNHAGLQENIPFVGSNERLPIRTRSIYE